MATSVHIPPPLLAAIDRRAKRLRVSRNRLIVRALERELTAGADWPPGFFDRLREVDDDLTVAVAELVTAVRGHRRSKAPRQL